MIVAQMPFRIQSLRPPYQNHLASNSTTRPGGTSNAAMLPESSARWSTQCRFGRRLPTLLIPDGNPTDVRHHVATFQHLSTQILSHDVCIVASPAAPLQICTWTCLDMQIWI